MSRNFAFAPKEHYHCYCRGVEKRKIFLNRKDYQRFVSLLFACNSKNIIHLSDYNEKPFGEIFKANRKDTIVDIGAYCLMPNHFHLLLHEKEEDGISNFMQKLMTGYTMYFNKKYERAGSLFESKFRAEHAGEDRHLKYLFSYMSLNPAKLVDPKWKEKTLKNSKELKDFVSNYEYSSYLDYVDSPLRIQGLILEKSAFPDYFIDKREFEEEIFDWLSFE